MISQPAQELQLQDVFFTKKGEFSQSDQWFPLTNATGCSGNPDSNQGPCDIRKIYSHML